MRTRSADRDARGAVKYELVPVPLYTGDLEPSSPPETRDCSSCKATFTTKRPGRLCGLCFNGYPHSKPG